MTVEELINTRPVSIYCITNDLDKRIHIVYTRSTVQSILNSIQKINESRLFRGDKDKLTFKIIESYDNRNNLYMKWRVEELYQEFEALGYTSYNERKALQWSLYYRVGTSTTPGIEDQYKAIVKIKTSENFVYNVREFDKVQSARTFVQSNTISSIVRLL
jgi:hypothetical protein